MGIAALVIGSSSTMRAARLGQDGAIKVEEMEIPTPGPGEALVRIVQAGICNTDIEIASRGYKGFAGTIGHEFVGVIDTIAANSHTDFCVGQRVVAEINCVPEGCGCRDYHERAQHPDRAALGIFKRDGIFAEFATVPLVNLHPVPDSLSDDEAMFAEPLAAACQILQQVHVKGTESVAVLGTGKLGILICQALAITGCHVVAMGRREDTFEPFKKRGIATKLTSDIADSEKYDIVVDCTGSEAGFNTALSITKPCGTLVLKSTFAGMTPADLTKVVVDEIKIQGSRCGPFAVALAFLEKKQVTVDGLITHRFTLDQTVEAIQKAGQKDSLKVAIRVAPVAPEQ